MYYAIDSSGSALHSGTRRCAKRGQCVSYPNHPILGLCQGLKLKIVDQKHSGHERHFYKDSNGTKHA